MKPQKARNYLTSSPVEHGMENSLPTAKCGLRYF